MKKMLQALCITVMMWLLVSCSVEKDDNVEQKISLENLESITLSIKEIGDEYFLAEKPIPSPLQYKVFAKLDKDYNGILTHTYPAYYNGWNVIAYPNGTLVDINGNEYPYLFWEGESNTEYDMSKGFCIPGDDTERFLRRKLSFMGLDKKELQDFIEFWVPFMEKNQYNKICFQSTAYTENAKLTVNPEPDSILRIYMVFQPLDEFIEIEEQLLTSFDRKGFTLVEWGGSIMK